MLTLIVTAILFAFAGCPDAEKDVTHPDLDAVMRELETPVARVVEDAGKVLPKRSPRAERPRRFERQPFGGGSL